MIDVFKATKIACCHAYGKRQIQVESYQNGKWAYQKHFKTILMGKTGVKILFFGRSNWGKEKGNLGHVVQIHVCRQVSLMTSLLTQTAYFRKIRLRSKANIDQYYPKKGLYRGNIIQYFHVAEKKEKNQWKSREFFISIKAQNYSIFYLIKVMRSLKQNERTKCEKHDPARTRTWNLLIRSQTPYPLGHEADIIYQEFYCYLTINCITNMHCNTVILCLHRDFYSFVVP